jgi:hypothetical protein
MHTEAAHVLGAGSYSTTNRELHRGSEESSGSAALGSAGVFCRRSFYATGKKLMSAAYNAVILLPRNSYRFSRCKECKLIDLALYKFATWA